MPSQFLKSSSNFGGLRPGAKQVNGQRLLLSLELAGRISEKQVACALDAQKGSLLLFLYLRARPRAELAGLTCERNAFMKV
jgi:hypothetical protein